MIFNFIKNKDKSVEVSNIDEITDLIADKVHAKNDEVMLLEQENDSLRQKLAASELTVSDYQKKINASDKKAESFRGELEFKVKQLKNLNSELTRIKNNYDELSKKKTDKKLKERNKELEKLLKNSESLIESNTIYRMTYEYISENKNKASVKDVFKHNLNVWMDNEGLTNVKAAEVLGVSDSAIAEWKNGRTALTVNSIQEVDLKLCEYFECSVYELVTEKMEGEEERRKLS